MIEVDKLSKIYGTFTAIRDVTFEVQPGEIMGFLGPNGAGKTTSMRILSGFLPATSGRARIAGFDVNENSMAVRQRIGYLPETPPLYTEMTVVDYLMFVAELKKVSAGDRVQRVNEAIKRCSLEEKRDTLIRKLSKGYKQRVGIAQAIVHDPPVIILDEPTVGLDPKQIIEVRNLIKSLAGDHTLILSTHILPEVSMTCDRVVIINRGQVVASGNPNDLAGQIEGSQVTFELEGSDTVIRPLLEKIPDVSLKALDQLTLSEDPTAARWTASLKGDDASDRWMRELVTALVQADIGIYEMRRSQATLEELFLQLTAQDVSPEFNQIPSANLSSQNSNQ